MKQLRSLIVAALVFAGLVPAIAQQFPTVPDNSVIGRIGTGSGSGPSQAIPLSRMQSALNSSVNSVAELRALRVGPSNQATVLGYYAQGDGGGGRFIWNSASTATDNNGSVIAVSGVTTGRWIRQTEIPNTYTPEMFGAKADGTSDANPIDDLMSYLGTVASAGGTMQLSCGKTYTLGLPSGTGPYGTRGNGLSIIRAFSNVAIVGCGDSSIIKMANNTNTSSSFFAWGIYNTNTMNNARFVDFTIDMNGANNSCSQTCYHSNAALGTYAGDSITVRNVKFLNNPGSNNTVFGSNLDPPTVTNLQLIGLVHEHNGDAVNAASADWSGDFFIASNVTYSNIRHYDGPRVNGSAFELHGLGITASDIVVTDHFNCGIIANEPSSFAATTANVELGNVACARVKGGVQVASKSGATETNIAIHDLNVNFLSGSSGIAIDACSVMDAATGAAANLAINSVTVKSTVTTNLGNEAPAISACRWASIAISNVQTLNTQAGAISIDNIIAGSIIGIRGVQATNPGRTSTAANQAAVVFGNTGAATAGNISIQDVKSVGTVRYNIIGSPNSSTGYIINNQANGATVGQVNWTGTGTFVYSLPASNMTFAGIDVAETFTALQAFTDSMFQLNGSTSGTLKLRAAAVAGTGIIRFPAGSTDFSATGGTSQFVKQASAGAALTVAQPAYSDLSGQMNTYSQITFSAGNLNPLLQASTWFFSTGPAASTENVVAVPMSQAGTIDKLYCSSNAAPGGAAQTFIQTARKNASDQTLTCTMTTGGASTCNDTTHSFAVVAGDLVNMKSVTSATSGTAGGMSCGMRFTTSSP